MPETIDTVLEFWFGSPAKSADEYVAKIRRWYAGGPSMDDEICERFGGLIDLAVGGGLVDWERDARGGLALILVLDQFTRSAFRRSPLTYAGDARAQRLTLQLLGNEAFAGLALDQQLFVVMPLTHAEDLALQGRSFSEYRAIYSRAPEWMKGPMAMGLEQTEKYLSIVRRFGRFPHRNEVLGRQSTAQETEFLRDWPERMPPQQLQGTANKPAGIILETTVGCGQTPRVMFAMEELGSAMPPCELQFQPDGHFLKTYGRPGPRLHDGPVTLQDSAAMLRHLARKYGPRELLPGSPTALAQVDEWMGFIAVGFVPPLLRWIEQQKRPAAERDEKELASARQTLDTAVGVLDRHFATCDWAAGTFSIADCALAILARFVTQFDLSDRPHVSAYVARLTARPAWKRSQEKLSALKQDVPQSLKGA